MSADLSSDDASAGIVGINVTPLVDVVLVLLVVLMVTARIVASDGLPMDLPKAATAGATMSVFVVAVEPGGRLTVDGKAVPSSEELRKLASEARAKEPELRAVVRASRAAVHGDVVRVLDDLRAVGISRVAFAAEKSP